LTPAQPVTFLRMTVIDVYSAHLQAAGRSARTIGERGALLHRADRELPEGLLRASTAELEHFLARFTGNTLCTYHTHLRCFYSWATRGRQPWLDWHPMEDMPWPRPPERDPDPVSDDELRTALNGSDRQWRLIIVLAAYAGLRVSEIAALARAEVTADRIRVHGKGDRVLLVATHDIVWEQIRDRPAGPLVLRPDGVQASGRWLSQMARQHFDALGLPRVHLHRFRHWYGTTLQLLQGDLLVTQRALRHRRPSTTAGYARVADRRVHDAERALPDVRYPPAAGPGSTL